jgi:uncharacterized protein YcfJ
MRKMFDWNFFWLFCLITPLAHAQADVVWANVESVTPRYAVTKLDRDQMCVGQRQVQYRQRFPSESAQVLGSIVGGLIGHELGHGYHRSAATFAGAALGGALVRDSQRAQYARSYACRESTVRRIVGYDVTYRWHNRPRNAFFRHAPGAKIRLHRVR